VEKATRWCELIVDGYFPCGWEGEFPSGRLVVSFRDGRLVEVQDRVATAGGKMLAAVGFTQRKWVDAIVTETYDTPKGLNCANNPFDSPLVEAWIFPSSGNVIRPHRLYSRTAVLTFEEDMSTSTSMSTPDLLLASCDAGRRNSSTPKDRSCLMATTARVRSMESHADLRHLHRIQENRNAGTSPAPLGSAAVLSTAKQLSTLAQAMNEVQEQLDEHGIPLDGDFPSGHANEPPQKCRESKKPSE
jgi:hypothetical protein